MSFKFNKNFVFAWHEYVHFGASLVLAYVFGFWIAFGLGLAWEIADGFKPWYTEGRGKPWIIQQTLYADGFSWSDLLFDSSGALAGILIRRII